MQVVKFLVLGIATINACQIDLTTKGLPTCEQACPEWCWATVISEIKEYYQIQSMMLPPVTAKCHNYECKVVSNMRKASCCNNSTECLPSSGSLGCGNPSSPEEIMKGFQLEIPKQKWIHMHGKPGFSCKPSDGCYPKEDVLQHLLMSNIPIARATHGHITTVSGCRMNDDGVVEYRVLDSLKDPSIQIWMNYTILTNGPPPGQGDGPWQNTYFSNATLNTLKK
jgi:hypothetical protein